MCLQMNINANEYNEYSENFIIPCALPKLSSQRNCTCQIIIHQSDLRVKDGRWSTHS